MNASIKHATNIEDHGYWLSQEGALIGYKLFRLLKDGALAPLFINKKLRIQPGKTYQAECHPTKGFAVRPGWHICSEQNAPHLSKKGRYGAWWHFMIIKSTSGRPRRAGFGIRLTRWSFWTYYSKHERI